MDTSGLKFAKPEPRMVDRIRYKRDLAAQERACRKAVKARDKGHCVVPFCKARSHHLHHITFRSQGGKWRTGNVCSLCLFHHRALHAGKIRIVGDADQELIITGDRRYLQVTL